MGKTQKSVGRHIIAELWGCNPEYLDDVSIVQEFMTNAAKEANATVLNCIFHTFQPHGVSGAVIIAESHLAIHTWSEISLASIDIYTCGTKADPWAAFKYLVKAFQSKKHTVCELKRGIFESDIDLEANYREQSSENLV